MCIVAKEVKEKSKVLPSMHPLRLVMKPRGKLNKLSEAKIKIFCKKKITFLFCKDFINIIFFRTSKMFWKTRANCWGKFFLTWVLLYYLLKLLFLFFYFFLVLKKWCSFYPTLTSVFVVEDSSVEPNGSFLIIIISNMAVVACSWPFTKNFKPFPINFNWYSNTYF